ncbi:phosphoinositide 3-kinase adapter protein 1 isoform X2 [Belonocnema kinseyi]|uniref:phosphoinositide 3-kinase adapter protein 1 isoform X2 n=1 Tax=Belonocnema kinseyi TaxID=2817044 RepID=UPI00143DFCE4|nr:phosphoinositide 3-kinase adapter protein 1 isoform X2 [Belonocnema kinseyi]
MKIKEETHYIKRSQNYFGTRHGTIPTPKNEPIIEDDVVIISSRDSEASTLWVNYLTGSFNQISQQQGRPPFRVSHLTVEDSMLPGTEERIRSSRLQIVVLCPYLLKRVLVRPEQAMNLSRHLVPDKVLAMMLGVQEDHLTSNHKSALISYQEWRKFPVKDQDEDFVCQFFGAVFSILGTSLPSSLKSDKTAFTVHPKKVKLGHSKVIVLLNDPLRPEDNVSVIVDRCGDAIEVNTVKRRNPYSLQFSIPDKCLEKSMLVGVRIIRNGCPIGVRQVKCESRLRELDQILRAHDNPLEFMCQTIGFNPGDRDQLDNWMVHAFRRNLPPHFNLLSTPSGTIPATKNYTSPDEYPTLLHFAARFGLEKLAFQLLETPGGDQASDLKNVSELTPADLAEQAGHTRLAQQLRSYMQMNEFTNIYSYLKIMSETPTDEPGNESGSPFLRNDDDGDKEDYCHPRPLSEAYSVPPAARPITTSLTSFSIPPELPPPNPSITASTEGNYSIAPTPTPITLPSTPTSIHNFHELDQTFSGYLQMHPAGLKTPALSITSSRLTLQSSRQDCSLAGIREDSINQFNGSSDKSICGSKSRETSGPQDELLEILNDFKNNVFTISELETLVEDWKNRNDVQQSFKDKQRQLTAMREEYERIQKKIKDDMKAPTPFERIRKLFTKGKKDSSKDSSHHNEDSASISKSENMNGTLADRRPVSSLSLHSVSSSSSSGRMSIVSGCSGTSLGDSGTHSDTEDRRIQNSREDKSGMLSYEIPPAPKPFTGRYSPARCTPSPRVQMNSEIDLRSPSAARIPQSSEHYIAFPPSGLPIHSYKADGSVREPKTPSSPIEASDYLDIEDIKKAHSYANFNPTSSILAPLPPPPPPPGMCIPFEYMNITPSAPSTPSTPPINLEKLIEYKVSKDSHPETDLKMPSKSNEIELSKEKNLEKKEDSKTPSEGETISESQKVKEDSLNLESLKNSVMEMESQLNGSIQKEKDDDKEKLNKEISPDVVDGACGADVTDSSVHDYMNLGPSSEGVQIVGMIPKKLAPPVPPRFTPVKK